MNEGEHLPSSGYGDVIHGSKIGKLNPLDEGESLVCFLDGVFRLRLRMRVCQLSEIFLRFPELQKRRLN